MNPSGAKKNEPYLLSSGKVPYSNMKFCAKVMIGDNATPLAPSVNCISDKPAPEGQVEKQEKATEDAISDARTLYSLLQVEKQKPRKLKSTPNLVVWTKRSG